MVRALASHHCGRGSIPAQCHMWVEFVVGSSLTERVFSLGSPVFLPSGKKALLNSNSTRIEDAHENQIRLMWILL